MLSKGGGGLLTRVTRRRRLVDVHCFDIVTVGKARGRLHTRSLSMHR